MRKVSWTGGFAVIALLSSLPADATVGCAAPYKCTSVNSSGAAYFQSSAKDYCEDHLKDAVDDIAPEDLGCSNGFSISPYIYTAVTYTNMRCNFVEPGSISPVGCAQWMVDCSAGVAAKCAAATTSVGPFTAGNGGSSPIVLNLGGGNFNFTDVANGVRFDLNADGAPERTAWLDPISGDAFLAFDRNGNGRIDDGTELFGDSTPQAASDTPNGYIALSHYDAITRGGNDDDLITPTDSIWPWLWLWRDRNQNGFSEHDEITFLSTTDVVEIDLRYVESRRKDRHGNELRYASKAALRDGGNVKTTDVFFVTGGAD